MYFKKVVSILVICVVAGSALAEESKPEVAPENVLNELSWSCANNASCVTRLARKVVQKLAARKPVDFGAFAIEPVERIPLTVEGRSSRALDFLSGNAVKFPIGPMVFNIERSADYPNFIEVSLLRKADGRTLRTNRTLGSLSNNPNLSILPYQQEPREPEARPVSTCASSCPHSWSSARSAGTRSPSPESSC